jgi:hypothetical protein
MPQDEQDASERSAVGYSAPSPAMGATASAAAKVNPPTKMDKRLNNCCWAGASKS